VGWATADITPLALDGWRCRQHTERNYQSLDNKIIQSGDEAGRHEGDVQCRERLGGMLRYYYRKAA